jgi:DNA topoisomerase III
VGEGFKARRICRRHALHGMRHLVAARVSRRLARLVRQDDAPDERLTGRAPHRRHPLAAAVGAWETLGPPRMTIAIVAEKPAVARDIARVLGAARPGKGCLTGGGYVVTWAIGHLVTLAEPHQMDPAWRHWRLDRLPMLPARWPLEVAPQTREQFEAVRRVLCDREVTRVVCATDAGREGELIFRYIYEATGCTKPVSRLWISSLTEAAIQQGFQRLQAGRAYDGLADAARGRSRADWLVGMNLSRAYSLAFGQDLSVGRVQTPTLSMVVARELAIRAFVPEDYLEVEATFGPAPPREGEAYKGTYFRPDLAPGVAGRAPGPRRGKDAGAAKEAGSAKDDEPDHARRLPKDGEESARILARALSGEASIASVEAETRRLPPPLFYDLTELQRHSNRLFGLSAQRTLDVAQALYERHKLISYPRTDSRHIARDVAATLGGVVRAIEGAYPGLVAPGSGTRPLGPRFVDDAKVTDHHAILPTGGRPSGALPADEQRLYDLICRRLLSAWHGDHVYAVTTVITVIRSLPEAAGGEAVVDRYTSSGTAVEDAGWKVLDLGYGARSVRRGAGKAKDAAPGEDEPARGDQALPGGLRKGERRKVKDALAIPKQTRPPPRFTEATLLTAMETAGRAVEERELAIAMRETGLGTPATRAAIIETLLRREYVVRAGKSLEATDKGVALIDVVHPDVKSPAMTGAWEAKLGKVQRGEQDLPSFMAAIEAYVREVVEKVKGAAPADVASGERARRAPSSSLAAATVGASPSPRTRSKGDAPALVPQRAEASPARTPVPPPRVSPPRVSPGAEEAISAARGVGSGDLRGLLRRAFGFEAFRPYQEAVCRAAAEGQDLLLVMPTGAGKSLCYQLPGLARGGTTLVVSPLIALMEDQVGKLQQQGFAAERIHSGRDRQDSRRVCVAYLEGKLDFLFIAPERLRVPGFPEMLARSKPTLIAVDEAHCISHWGHDFRPDYRMLGERLPLLRPAPILALTATATPLVQDDILAQLGLGDAARFIHGFRRTNLGVEILDLAPSERFERARELLAEGSRRPAIVYAPTRKDVEELASRLSAEMPAAAYHAGMDPGARDRVQSAFLDGRIEVVVATIAFGMGIDKADVRTVVHTALPASLEAYYQEIGRAGRDGGLARAVLMHSFVDLRTHEFFHERDYPDPAVLAAIFAKLPRDPVPREALSRALDLDPEALDKALDKLLIHGGARLAEGFLVARGAKGWERPYEAQRRYKLDQLARMARFTQGHDCRMVALVRHFGDQEDPGEPCGLCDACAPDRCLVRRFRAPSRTEAAAIAQILGALGRDGEAPTGRLHRETFGDTLDRRSFEHLLGGLVRAGLVRVTEASFEKDGEPISFMRAALTARGAGWEGEVPAEISLAEAREKKPAAERSKSRAAFFAKRARGKGGAGVSRSGARGKGSKGGRGKGGRRFPS